MAEGSLNLPDWETVAPIRIGRGGPAIPDDGTSSIKTIRILSFAEKFFRMPCSRTKSLVQDGTI
jgi:hypothetical protein